MPKTWTTNLSSKTRLVAVPAILQGPLGRKKAAHLVLDTGTQVTILDTALATSIDLTADRTIGPSRLIGPTGLEEGYKVRVSSLTVMDESLQDFVVRCHDLPQDLQVDGLLGLDIIRRGALLLDLPQGRLEFRWA